VKDVDGMFAPSHGNEDRGDGGVMVAMGGSILSRWWECHDGVQHDEDKERSQELLHVRRGDIEAP
jgi:hypothetical protein